MLDTHLFFLLLTILIEFSVFFILLKDGFYRILLFVVLINSFTQPIATYGYYYLISNLWVVEGFVVVVETLLVKYLFEINYYEALKVTFVANLITSLVSFIFIG